MKRPFMKRRDALKWMGTAAAAAAVRPVVAPGWELLAPLHALASTDDSATPDARTTAAARDFMTAESYGAEERCPTSRAHLADSFVSPNRASLREHTGGRR